jgi:endonuclease/exonuclease/phosphatase (EEP) superfamily protein YafD
MVLAAAALSLLRDWRCVILSNFSPHIAAAAVVFAVLVLAADLGSDTRLVVLALLALAVVVVVSRILRSVRRSTQPSDGRRLRLLFANVLESNRAHARLLDWVRDEQPDVVVVAEALLSWQQALMALEKDFPHWTACRMGDVRIFSRRPFETEPLDVFPEIGYAVVVKVDGVTILGVHTASPEDERRSRSLDELLVQVSEIVRRTDGPVVVVGDFNAAPWTLPVQRLIGETGLTCGPGALISTFPIAYRGLRFPRWLGIPIDIVMAGNGARVALRRHGPDIGSDHWPMAAELVVHAGDNVKPTT